NQMGILAKRNGSIIMMRHASVVVDDVCSGLRSLISLTALGSIFAFWLNGPGWKKVVLFLTTIPIAIITNVCRVVFLATVSEIWGAEAASGFVHDASGFLIFALAFVLLLGVSKVIE
ncbi:MAG: exosortase/archaeosortase family protein, partial [Candidatus Omnitrophota bacterium]